MVHSYDKTLLSSLGFQDLDKKNKRHDIACRYVSQPHIISKLLEKIFPELKSVSIDVRQEYHLTKGENQYKTTIGFLDSIVVFNGIVNDKLYNGYLLIEVKINKISIGDILRQINLYKEYLVGTFQIRYDFLKGISEHKLKTVLVVDFELSNEEYSLLNDSGIYPVRLSGDFDSYINKSSKSSSVFEI